MVVRKVICSLGIPKINVGMCESDLFVTETSNSKSLFRLCTTNAARHGRMVRKGPLLPVTVFHKREREGVLEA
jgi:hypothetical protein